MKSIGHRTVLVFCSSAISRWARALIPCLVLGSTVLQSLAVQPDRNLSQLIHETWQTDDGLPQNAVYSLAQDHDGFIWFGTENGLVRFDGVLFEVFNERGRPAVPHNYTSSLLVAKDGTIWGAAGTGAVWRHRFGKFEEPFPELAYVPVYHLAEGIDGTIWAATKEGLYELRERATRFNLMGSAEGNRFTAIAPRPDGSLWLGNYAGDLVRFKNGIFETVIPRTPSQPGGGIKSLALDPLTGELWIGRDGAGLSVLGTNGVKNIDLFPNEIYEFPHTIHLDTTGVLWIGTPNAGLVRYQNGNISTLTEDDGFPDNDVLSVIKDREGSVWVGTHFGGLNRLIEGKATTYSEREGLPPFRVTCVVTNDAENIWVGTRGGGLYKLSHCVFTPVPFPEGSDNGRLDIRAMLQTPDGTLWVGSNSGELGTVSTNGTVRFFSREAGLTGASITTLFHRKNGELWVGTIRGDILIAEPGRERFRNVPVPDFMRTHIRSIAEDSTGALWIGTQNDLVRFTNNTFVQIELPAAPDLSVRTLVCDPDDTLWIGSRDSGLIRFRNGQVNRFDSGQGLHHNRIYQLLSVGDDLWLAGNEGIEQVRKSEFDRVAREPGLRLVTQILTKRDGLRTEECGGDYSPSAAIDGNGALWFGTRKGLSKVDPTPKPEQTFGPNVLITSVTVDNERMIPAKFPGLKPGARRLQINYTALSLRNPANVFFKYQLENVDSQWVDAGHTREVVYYSLKPGDYKFRVKACNDEGVWNEAGASLAFTVAPLIHQTLWARAAGGFVILGVVAGFFRWRVRSIRRHNRELEHLVTERTREMQSEVVQRADAEHRLRILNEELEARVKARTVELRNAYENLQFELHERLEVEQALARSEARMRRVVDSGMVGILFWHKDGSISDANATFLKMVGYTREDLENGSIFWERLTPPEFLHLDAFALREIEKSGVCTPFEKEYIRKDGSRIPILIGGASLTTDAERGVCFVIDISERKASESEVLRLNQMLEARVHERTTELARANEQLAAEVVERKRVGVALAAFSHLGQNLHSARTEKEAAAIVADTAKTLIPHDVCSIELYDTDGQLAPVLDRAETGAKLPTDKPFSSISVSIRNGSRVVGVLGLKSTNVNGFNYADANTLQALGDYCGGALERIHAAEARRETERRFSTFMTNAPALAWMKDEQFRYVFTNEMFQRFTGLSAEQIEGKTDYDLWPDHVAFHMRNHDSQTVSTQSKRETQEQLRRHDGETRTLLTLRFLFPTGSGEKFVAGMAVDITEQKRAEEALHRLPQSILEAQEAERRRVARELHDGVNQAIASVKFRIQTAEQQFLRADPKWQETCGKSKEMLDSVLQQVRRLSRNLRPGELDDFGLVAAARSACQEFELRTGINVKFTHSEFTVRLPSTLELSLYRIIQEALTNAEKHSSATVVSIDLEEDGDSVMLEISDNGCGFDPGKDKEPSAGLGLLHMRERASLVGAVFALHSAPGQGVRINIHAPVNRQMVANND